MHALNAGRSAHPPQQDFLAAFRRAFGARGITPDSAQAAAAQRLQQLYRQLMAFKQARRTKLRKLLVHPPIPRGSSWIASCTVTPGAATARARSRVA